MGFEKEISSKYIDSVKYMYGQRTTSVYFILIDKILEMVYVKLELPKGIL